MLTCNKSWVYNLEGVNADNNERKMAGSFMPQRFCSFLLILSSLTLFLGCFFFYYNHFGLNYTDFKPASNLIRTTGIVKNESGDGSTKYILLWTTFFGQADYLPMPGPEVGCPSLSSCKVTSDRKLYYNSGVVLFHWSDISELPKYRVKGQYWMIFVLESPHHTGSFQVWDGVMNLSATYRLDSDVFTPYKSFREMTPEEVGGLGPEKDYSKGKTKMVAWFVSNCNTPSNREGYVRELAKHIEVDIYGDCGDHECRPRMSPECYQNISAQYLFYLSFENSICRDYVTEKYYHILQRPMVPVVMGGANYSAVGPPGAFVDASLYPDPSDLGRELKRISGDPKLYNQYFKWKRKYVLPGRDWVCDVCEILSGVRPVQEHPGRKLHNWWVEQADCRTWSKGQFLPYT